MASRRTKLTPEETEKILRIKHLFEHATKVFGSEEEARHWLNNPAYGLEGQRPIDLLDTEPGAMQVRDYLGAIEYGNYW
jgi:putative toxin-antitoxin system antitoxin component (TIGR02293 family)